MKTILFLFLAVAFAESQNINNNRGYGHLPHNMHGPMHGLRELKNFLKDVKLVCETNNQFMCQFTFKEVDESFQPSRDNPVAEWMTTTRSII